MSTRKVAKSTAASKQKGKKAVEETVVVAPPEKTDDELLQEQLAATLLAIPPIVAVQPLHSPADVLWTLSLKEIRKFCFPPGEQHPLSRGRLCVLADSGPLVRRHTYLACLCAGCQQLVRERRKTDAYAARVFNGELFTEANVPLRRKKKATTTTAATHGANGAAADEEAAAAAAHLPSPAVTFVGATPIPALRALHIPPTTASSARLITPSGRDGSFRLSPAASPQVTFRPDQTLPAVSTGALSSTVAAAPAAAAAAAAASSPPPPSSTLHNSVAPASALHPEYFTHTVDQLDFLCAQCQEHARSQAHILGGVGGRHVLTALQLNELARRIEEEDLLRAYNRWQVLEPREERDFLAKLDGEKVRRARCNYTPEQVEHILAKVPRLPNSESTAAAAATAAATATPADGSHASARVSSSHVGGSSSSSSLARMDFYKVQSVVREERGVRVARLSEMYPDAAHKGDTSLQAGAVTRADPKVRGNDAKWAKREGREEEQKEVNGVRWMGESVLTTAMLHRQYPPHQAGHLRSRLLHKHTHQVAELTSINHPSIQLSVALMRNQHRTDRTEGWKTQF